MSLKPDFKDEKELLHIRYIAKKYPEKNKIRIDISTD
jgi:hypothetical protein